VWAHLLAFDALHTIAISLLAASLVFALPWRSREKAALFLALAVLSVSLGMRPPTPLPVLPRDLPNSPALLALVQAVGGTSPFSLFPWSAYFFVGSALGLLLRPDRRSALWMAATGALLAISNLWTGVGEMPLGHPVLFLCRTGAVLLLLAALTLVPASIAARAEPLGRASLGVYAIHVPIVYGWSNQLGLVDRVGQRLSLPVSLVVAALVLAVSLTLLRGGQASWRSLWDALRRRRPLVGGKKGLPAHVNHAPST
jgi:peptidoglycan/LPS O-acetylase OafA/YrhL